MFWILYYQLNKITLPIFFYFSKNGKWYWVQSREDKHEWFRQYDETTCSGWNKLTKQRKWRKRRKWWNEGNKENEENKGNEKHEEKKRKGTKWREWRKRRN